MTWAVGLLSRKGKSAVESDGRCVTNYIYTYIARTTGSFPSCAAVSAAVGVTRGSPCPEDSNAIAKSVSVDDWTQPTRQPFLAFTVAVEYATNAPLPDADDDNPITRRTLWGGGTQVQQRHITEDKDGVLIVDAAGQPFDGGIGVNERTAVHRFTRNVDASGYDRDEMMANNDKLNDVPFLGYDEETLQLEFGAEEVYEGAWHFYRETYAFFYNPLGWQPSAVDAGFYCRDVVDGPVHRITNQDLGDTNPLTKDNECPTPQPLDANGVIIPIPDRPADCRFVGATHFETMDFNDFGL